MQFDDTRRARSRVESVDVLSQHRQVLVRPKLLLRLRDRNVSGIGLCLSVIAGSRAGSVKAAGA